MTLTLSVVHTPAAVGHTRWEHLRRQAPGHGDHDIRLRVTGAGHPSGEQLARALVSWLGARPGEVSALVAGVQLDTLPSGSSLIHPGMVVVLLSSGPTIASPTDHDARRAVLPPLQMCLDQGPDAGRLVSLSRGIHRLGRGRTDVQVADPQMRREHLVIEVDTRSVTVSHEVDPAQAPATRRLPAATWSTGESRVEGSSVLRLVTGPATSVSPLCARWPPDLEEVDEQPPEGRHRMMLLMALVPLVIGIVMVTLTGMWFFLLFSGISALVAVLTIADAARRRRRFRRAVTTAAARWAARVDDLLDTPGDIIRRLRDTLHHGVPGASAESGQSRSWSITAAPQETGEYRLAHVVRLGRGITLPGLDLGSGVKTPGDVSIECGIALSLRPGEATRISGPPRATRRLLRWILCQLLIRPGSARSPVLLATVSAHADPVHADSKHWGGHLEDHPDVRVLSPESLAEALPRAAPEYRATDESDPMTIPVLLAEAQIPEESLSRALHQGWSVVILQLAQGTQDSGNMAAGAGWNVDLNAGELHRLGPSGAAVEVPTVWELIGDGLSADVLDEHLRLALPHCAALDRGVGLPDHHETPLPSQLMNRSAIDSLVTVLGRGQGEDEDIDLVEDGPHILIAGTSGSGKSELLKSLILGWAAQYRPEELNVVLFDFKGGSTFQHLAGLEHSLALITDLSQAQAERTLEGIRSELVRRERLFLEAGAGDYPEYRRLRPDHPLARILVVIDEFRIFTHELPETMDELMRLATLGRSLGLHLVLSTQRPQGVVTADIRANIGSVVTLRLRSEDESRDLVGTPEAGRIPRHLPGRGIIQRPGEQPVMFQTGLLTPQNQQLELIPDATRHRESRQAVPGPLQPERSTGVGAEATGQVTAALRQRCEDADLRRRHTPLLPPLPEELSAPEMASDLPASEVDTPDAVDAGLAAPLRTPVLGRLDLPSEQQQHDLLFDPASSGSIGLIGEGESGGREALIALASQLLGPNEDDAHLPPVNQALRPAVYLLDADRTLQRFADHPRVGSWLSDEHPAEAGHLLELLHDEMIARRSHLSTDASPLVVLLSGHGQWHQLSQSPAAGSLEHLLGRLVGEGADVGISVVLSGGRELTSGRLGARLARRIHLPHAVSADTRLLWPRLKSVDSIPGRGVLISPEHPSPGAEIQLVTRPASQHTQGQRSVSKPHKVGAQAPRITVRPLPDRVTRAELGAGAPVIGVDQFTHQHVPWRDTPVTLILGTSGTGRSTCLDTLSHHVDSIVMRDPETPWEDDPPAGTVLVDDADRCTAEQHRLIERWIHQGTQIVATAQPSPALFSSIPWAHHARASSMNMVLSPTHRSQGDFFAVTVPVLSRPIPGRAVHIRADGPRLVQWALP